MIDGLKSLKTSQGHVLKFVLNNAANSRIRVLIWGTALALKYEPSILEFHVQPHSVLRFHGEYKRNLISEPSVLFRNIPFDDVMIVDGPIRKFLLLQEEFK